ncbi:hypothetical protein H1R20_g6484, partial [Candolleomyces eurysporus]
MNIGSAIYMSRVHRNMQRPGDDFDLKVFRKFCVDQGLSKAILATTGWDRYLPESGESNWENLDTLWGNIISELGPHTEAETTALWDTRESAWNLIRLVLTQRAESRIDGAVLNIQKQPVDQGKKLEDTDNAQRLHPRLEALLKGSGSFPAQALKDKRVPLGTRILSSPGFS